MSNYLAVTATIFLIVAVLHIVRLVNKWGVQIGPHVIPMSVSWIGLLVSGALALWGFMQFGH